MATTQKFKMLPSFYQACLQANLSEAQYLTLQILILLLQGHRTVQLERLAALFRLFWFLCGNEVYTDSLFNKIVLKVFPSKHFTIS
ncbi:hypothetical protein MICAD_1100001 [Microcystis aeruginosa PCC 7941]|jgi:hypothetical protein|nr:hypothetical protein MICAD_1100001 [Microcystis aeruginosa PCC 7941]